MYIAITGKLADYLLLLSHLIDANQTLNLLGTSSLPGVALEIILTFFSFTLTFYMLF